MKHFLSVSFASLFLMSSIFGISPAIAGGDIKWVGCGISKKAYVTELAKKYEAKTGVKVDLQGGGATKGIREVAAGKADIGGSCRHKIHSDEEKTAVLNHVAWDAIVVIAHPSNPVKNISTDQLKGVFSGSITNWSELGGPDAPIEVVVRRGKMSGVGMIARELVFKNPDQDFAASAIKLKSTGPVEKHVEANKYSIAMSGISSAKKRNVSFMSLNGHEPSYANIASGAYPLYRPLYLVTRQDTPKEVMDFIDYAKSQEGQEIIKAEGTVNLQDGSKLWPLYAENMRAARQEGNF